MPIIEKNTFLSFCINFIQTNPQINRHSVSGDDFHDIWLIYEKYYGFLLIIRRTVVISFSDTVHGVSREFDLYI